jgi:threonine aldolase
MVNLIQLGKQIKRQNMIDLRSDTVTSPTPDMREFMLKAEVGDDVFGEDPTVNNLQTRIAEMLSKEAALFVASGTQANQISINAHTNPGQEIVCDYNAHIFNYEAGAPAMLSGTQIHPILGKYGHPTFEQIQEVVRPSDDHFAQTRLICLENTHNRAGGTIFPIHEIKRISSFAKEKGLKLHLDGARLWNAAIATGISLAEYASYFDSVSLCFSKGLGAPIGSIIVGTRDFIKRVHYYRKAYGGGMRQVGMLAAACIFAVENHFERLIDDHQHAHLLAEALNSYNGLRVEMETVQSNIVILHVQDIGFSVNQLVEMFKKEGILVIAFSPTKIRLVTHLQISRNDINKCLKVFSKLFK